MVIFLFSVIFSGVLLSGECLVALDIGHTIKKYGARSSRGVGEYAFNRRAGIMLYYALSDISIPSFFVNQREEEIQLQDRWENALHGGATLFISLHHDSAKEKYLSTWVYHGRSEHYCDLFSGYSIFVSKKDAFYSESLLLAKYIGANMRLSGLSPSMHHSEPIKGENKEILDRNNGVFSYNNLLVLKKSEMPSVLIEHEVIVNRRAEKVAWSEERLLLQASATAAGIKEYCTRRTQ